MRLRIRVAAQTTVTRLRWLTTVTRLRWLPTVNAQNGMPGRLPEPTATAAAAPAHALCAAAATRGSARSSAAAASLPLLCATSSGVLPPCSRGEGRGAVRRVPEPPLRAPHSFCLCQRVHPRGREEEGDDGGAAIECRPMQRGLAALQGRVRRGREDGGRGREGGRRGREGTRPGGRRGGAAGEHRGPQEAIHTAGAPGRKYSTAPQLSGLWPIA